MEPQRTTDPTGVDFKKKFDLAGKVIIVTGACGLVGRAFCEAILQFGGTVVAADIKAANPEAYGAELAQRYPKKSIGVAVDVEDKNSISALKDAALKEFTAISGLVLAHQNKSHLKFEPFEEVTEENWNKVLGVNLTGTFLACQVLGGYMAAQGSGVIVTMPSTYSEVAPNQHLYEGTSLGCPAEYSASKGGVYALSRYLASYWAAKGVRVNMLTPHGVWNNHEAEFEKNFARFSPMERMSYNHEVAATLIYMLSDASSYMTGATVLNDGGWTVW